MSIRNSIVHSGVMPADEHKPEAQAPEAQPERGPLELLGQVSDEVLRKAAGAALFVASFFVGR